MAWYAVYRVSDGGLISIGTSVDPGALDPAYAFIPIPHRPDWTTEVWDSITHTLIAKPFDAGSFIRGPIRDAYEVWLLWKTSKAEAVARGLPAGVITKITAQETTAWNDYVAVLTTWYNSLP